MYLYKLMVFKWKKTYLYGLNVLKNIYTVSNRKLSTLNKIGKNNVRFGTKKHSVKVERKN